MTIKEQMELISNFSASVLECDKLEFMAIMCMIFDDYHRLHRDVDEVEVSRAVADQVEALNSLMGEYL